MSKEKLLLDFRDIECIYGISKWTFYKWTARRLFPLVKLGSRVYVSRADFEKFISNNTINSTSGGGTNG